MKLSELYSWAQTYDDFYDFKEDLKKLLPEERLKKLEPGWFDKLLDIQNYNHNNNVSILSPLKCDYPKSLLGLKNPPLCLSVVGNKEVLQKPSVSVVGSRHPSQQVLNWMDENLGELAKRGFVIVSGAARGIDQKAHACALRNNSPTVAFLPSGLCTMYPENFILWKSKILDAGGAIVSEYSPYQLILPHHFHQRNRMIAALGLATLVCQARRKSGSTLTANLAIENSKPVCVLPFFPTDVMSQGTVDLLFQGAFPIRDWMDMLTILSVEKEKQGLYYHQSPLLIPDSF